MEIGTYLTENGIILIPVLIIIGTIIKDIEKIHDKWIPLILLPFGIVGAIALMGISANAIMQGILLTGAAVYGNQIYKQMKKNDQYIYCINFFLFIY